jgi:hypothetical protein
MPLAAAFRVYTRKKRRIADGDDAATGNAPLALIENPSSASSLGPMSSALPAGSSASAPAAATPPPKPPASITAASPPPLLGSSAAPAAAVHKVVGVALAPPKPL